MDYTEKKIRVITGGSGAGKSTLLDLLRDNYNILVSTTSRRPRKGEIDGIHYNFRDIDFFENSPEDIWVERANHGGTYYGILRKDFVDDNYFAVLNLEGVEKFKKLGVDVEIIYLKTSFDTLRSRILSDESLSYIDQTERIKRFEFEDDMLEELEKCSDYIIETDNKTPAEVLSELETKLSLN